VTVAELVKLLRNVPPDYEVILDCGAYRDVHSVEKNRTFKWIAFSSDEKDEKEIMSEKEIVESTAVRHHFTVTVTVPAKSGDGWSRFPDYSADEVGRMLRRALYDRLEFDDTVEWQKTEEVEE